MVVFLEECRFLHIYFSVCAGYTCLCVFIHSLHAPSYKPSPPHLLLTCDISRTEEMLSFYVTGFNFLAWHKNKCISPKLQVTFEKGNVRCLKFCRFKNYTDELFFLNVFLVLEESCLFAKNNGRTFAPWDISSQRPVVPLIRSACLTEELRGVWTVLRSVPASRVRCFTELLQCVLWSCDLCREQALVQARYLCFFSEGCSNNHCLFILYFVGWTVCLDSVFEVLYAYTCVCIWGCAHAPDATCRCFIYVFYIKIKSCITFWHLAFFGFYFLLPHTVQI